MELKGQPRVVLQDGISGDFILQRFFLRSTTDDDEDGDEMEGGVGSSDDPTDPRSPKSEKRSKKKKSQGENESSELIPEQSNKSGYFVPSIVYLPVRAKVSGALRVSFSLTPTS